ncbi:hypothetical protein [Microvirga guangxiensis]|uniref:Uncharacterized protein n=1 Tax=Microvirga guangxiensis TaxID=549386 RepID=A0A1G5BNQ5_9HYPH|nr:hypothetical protein [Microvirga guangxiensis]SCX91716.1 hypothetical protein SAMN02927923_00297 [Microvirga guangxiensis]
MPREVTDPDGITWTCIQAFSGLGKNPEKMEAARVDGEADAFQVVCTPSGGAQSVRIELPGDWEQGYSDEQLLKTIQAQLAQNP